jgi:hypothetical protein
MWSLASCRRRRQEVLEIEAVGGAVGAARASSSLVSDQGRLFAECGAGSVACERSIE